MQRIKFQNPVALSLKIKVLHSWASVLWLVWYSHYNTCSQLVHVVQTEIHLCTSLGQVYFEYTTSLSTRCWTHKQAYRSLASSKVERKKSHKFRKTLSPVAAWVNQHIYFLFGFHTNPYKISSDRSNLVSTLTIFEAAHVGAYTHIDNI